MSQNLYSDNLLPSSQGQNQKRSQILVADSEEKPEDVVNQNPEP
jgi:hypothetical protein